MKWAIAYNSHKISKVASNINVTGGEPPIAIEFIENWSPQDIAWRSLSTGGYLARTVQQQQKVQ